MSSGSSLTPQSATTWTVHLMLGAGWPVNARGKHGATALHFAAWHGNLEMVRHIMERRPPIEAATTTSTGHPSCGRFTDRCMGGTAGAEITAERPLLSSARERSSRHR